MDFPIITFKGTNCDLDMELQNLAEQKLRSLEKHLHEGNTVQCDVEFEKETAHQSGKHYRFEVNLMVEGELFRVEATEENFEAAIDEARDELDKQLRRSNDKKQTQQRNGAREIKQMITQG